MGKFSGESEFVAVLNFLSLNNLRLALELLCFHFDQILLIQKWFKSVLVLKV